MPSASQRTLPRPKPLPLMSSTLHFCATVPLCPFLCMRFGCFRVQFPRNTVSLSAALIFATPQIPSDNFYSQSFRFVCVFVCVLCPEAAVPTPHWVPCAVFHHDARTHAAPTAMHPKALCPSLRMDPLTCLYSLCVTRNRGGKPGGTLREAAATTAAGGRPT